jgi:putative ABC transport system permease protein
MNFLESFEVAAAALRANKMRSLLTMLGIIIGVAAVIAMMALGQGAQVAVKKSIQSMGNNLLSVFPGQFRGPGSSLGQSRPLSIEDSEKIASSVSGVVAVAPEINRSFQVKHDEKTWNTRIVGTTPDYGEVRNFSLSSGSFFREADQVGKRKVCVIGETVRQNLFDEGEDPLGQEIKINRVNFTVIGVLTKKGASGFFDQDDQIILPINTAIARLFGGSRNRGLSTISVQAASEGVMPGVQDEITSLLRREHKLGLQDEDDFSVRSQTEILKAMQSTTQTFTFLLAGIALVSLLVGGIGIMNIMLVSVTERTREIGVRKAVGARRSDILGQFLIESVVLSLVGGVIGILLGVVGARLLSQLAGWNTLILPGSILLAFLFSSSVGVFFGYYPARRAAGMDPIVALRWE